MKFKNVKKKAGSIESPSNSRTITEPFKFSFPKITSTILFRAYRVALKVFIVLIFILVSVIVGLDLEANTKIKKAIDLERQALTTDLKFWENFIAEHKDYRDAYFQASILEYKLGNSAKAEMYVEKGLSLDPNSQDGKRIEDFLSK